MRNPIKYGDLAENLHCIGEAASLALRLELGYGVALEGTLGGDHMLRVLVKFNALDPGDKVNDNPSGPGML